jgi:8-oxo-dGTP pyrophosphatase MutT (NUDIX family)
MSQDATQPVPALPSATIVMLRDSDRRPEILLVKRKAGDAFGESYTFPGGVVDADESNAHSFCQGLSADDANEILNVTDGGLDFYSAAIRELFEETGLLLAREQQGRWPTDNQQLQILRAAIIQGQLSWSDFLQRQGLRIACDAMHYFAHWVTPMQLPKRWSTRFFLAEAPTGQDARHDGAELTDSRWLTAAIAIEHGRDGSMKIPHPTYKTLWVLGGLNSVDAALEWAQSQTRKGVPTIRPTLRAQEGKTRIVMPGDPDYPEDAEH